LPVQLAEPAHDLDPFAAVQAVDEQFAAQVAGLVLQAAGQLTGAGDGDRIAVQVRPGNRGSRGAANLRPAHFDNLVMRRSSVRSR
jgi:hypothetical protein